MFVAAHEKECQSKITYHGIRFHHRPYGAVIPMLLLPFLSTEPGNEKINRMKNYYSIQKMIFKGAEELFHLSCQI